MKRVLIICYYWPPAGGPGVQRWLKFVKYFREFGIEPVVFVPENAHYPMQDESFISEIPEGITIIKHPIKEPYRFAKLFSKKRTKQISSGIITEKDPSLLEKILLFVRGNLFIPDARVGWVKPSVRILSDYLEQEEIDTIITTGPPHSLHLIGLGLKKALNVKWVADFRDPWTTIHYHNSLRLTTSSAAKHKALETEVLQTADHVVVTSKNTKREFTALTKKPITVITNGFDGESLASRPTLDETFSLVHIGSLLSNRNPVILWKVVSELASENERFQQALSIQLVGIVGAEIEESLQAFGLVEYVSLPGYIGHKEALQKQRSAQVLLLIEMNRPETMAILPGKMFEYLHANRPILALGPEGSDIEEIVANTKTGAFFDYSQEKALKKYVLACFERYENNLLYNNAAAIDGYHRRALTNKMATLINSL